MSPSMHTVNESKIAVRQALVTTLSVMRAGGDVEVAGEALQLEKQYRKEIEALEKQNREPELALVSDDHKHAA